MANLSDAFGTIKVKKVGKEFLEFLNEVQGEDAYYTLVDRYDVKDIKPDDDGNIKFSFGTAGRWAYGNNLEGYLNGTWMDNTDKQRDAYKKFISALKKKNGSVTIEYTDSDTAMDWMGTGVATLLVVKGKVNLSNDFEEERITIARYAEVNGESEYWALGYIYGDEVSEAYDKYTDGCKALNQEPVEPDKWMSTIYESEE